MPTAADITIKKADETTNIVWTLVVASGGDKSPAVWRSNTVAGAAGNRPEARMTSLNNGSNSGRKFILNFTYPSVYTDTSTSVSNVLTRANATLEGFLPAAMPDADANEFGAQLGNLIASSLIKSSMKSGFAPT